MAELTVRLDLSFGARSVRVLMTGAMLFATVTEVASESVTLTTYYPAPSGVYTQMITTGNTFLARDSGQVGIGTTTPGQELDVAGANGNIRATGEIQSTMTNGGAFGQMRMIAGSYGAFFRNDGADTYFLLTNSGNQYGVWNGYRPFRVNNPTGDVYMQGTSLYVRASDGRVGLGTPSPSQVLDVIGAEANYGYTPHYQNWATYGTGDGGAAIYNDNNGYKTLMLVGNNSAGGQRRVSVWDSLMVNGGTGGGSITVTDPSCMEVQYAMTGYTTCAAAGFGGPSYATVQSGVISYYTIMPLYSNPGGGPSTAPMLCCTCPASGCPL